VGYAMKTPSNRSVLFNKPISGSEIIMAENNSKTFIIGIVIFVLLVIGGFMVFAKKDVAVDQTQAEMTAAPAPADATAPTAAPAPVPAQTGEGEAAAPAPAAPAPAPDATPAPTPAPEAAPAPAPAQ
jgi:hypothetical protein